MDDKALKLLGLMRKANSVQIGETNTGSVAKEGKAKLLLLAADASENARTRLESFSRGHSAGIVCLPYTKTELSESLGVGGCSMAAVTDLGFADALLKLLCASNPEEYLPASQELSQRYEKAKRRKAATHCQQPHKKPNGKRRTNI